MPRRLCVMAGSSTARIDESLMTHTSAWIRSLCSLTHGTRFGEDTSSSPSSRIFTLTGAPLRAAAARLQVRLERLDLDEELSLVVRGPAARRSCRP